MAAEEHVIKCGLRADKGHTEFLYGHDFCSRLHGWCMELLSESLQGSAGTPSPREPRAFVMQLLRGAKFSQTASPPSLVAAPKWQSSDSIRGNCIVARRDQIVELLGRGEESEVTLSLGS